MKILLFIILLPIVAFLIYLAVLFAMGATVDMKKPLEKVYKFTRTQIDFVIPKFNWLWGVRLTKSGFEKLPENERFVVVCNHRSMFDPLTAIDAFRGYDMSYISKPENFKLPLVGPYMYGIGSVAIDRENDRQALKDILQAADYIKRGLCSMCIYPEGTRSKDAELLPFHAGSFKLAQKAGVGIAVAAVDGTEKVKNRLFRKTKVHLAILDFIPAEKVKEMKATELADYSRNMIMEHLN